MEAGLEMKYQAVAPHSVGQSWRSAVGGPRWRGLHGCVIPPCHPHPATHFPAIVLHPLLLLLCSQIRHLEGGAGCMRVPAQHRAFPPAPRGGSTHPFAHLLPGCPCPGGGALTCGVHVLPPVLGWVPASLAGYPRCSETLEASPGQGRVAMLSPGRMGPHQTNEN